MFRMSIIRPALDGKMKKRLDDCNNEEKKLISCRIQVTIYMSIKHGSFLSNIGDVLHVRVPVFFVCVVAQQHVFGSLKCKETEEDGLTLQNVNRSVCNGVQSQVFPSSELKVSNSKASETRFIKHTCRMKAILAGSRKSF